MSSVRKTVETPEHPMSREAYRAWVMSQPRGRFERVDGVVYAMAAERTGHAMRKAMVWLALREAVRRATTDCQVYPDGVTVEVGGSDYEPDALVHCGTMVPSDAIAINDPVIVVEVLSPSTRNVDLMKKLVDYFTLPSVRHYLILFSDEPKIIHHRRREDGIDTIIISSGAIRLDPPGIEITVEEIYP